MGKYKRKSKSVADALEDYRKECIKVAQQLEYDESVIEKLKNAKTEYDITRILSKARNED